MSNQSQHLTAWHALSRSHARLEAHLETALKAAALPPLDMLDALQALSDTTGPHNAKTLETQLARPQYAVSRLLDRMEKLALITRHSDAQDKRIKHLSLTASGQKALAEMITTRDAALAAYLAPRARPGQLERLADLLSLLDQDAPT